MRVYILGAGASLFAGFPTASELLPFVKHSWRTSGVLPSQNDGTNLLGFIDDIFPLIPEKWIFENGQPDLEFIFALLDRLQYPDHRYDKKQQQIIDHLDKLKLNPKCLKLKPNRLKTAFRSLVASAFIFHSYDQLNALSLDSSSTLSSIARCWGRKVNSGDCIISFNWDILHDIIMYIARNWSYIDGYGTSCVALSNASPIKILKLHGSCNWALKRRNDFAFCVDYINPFFDLNYFDDDAHPLELTSDFGDSLITPSYLKNPSAVPSLQSIWSQARSSISSANELVVIGYSLPHGDCYAYSLIRDALAQNKSITSIMLVLGADKNAADQWEKMFDEVQVSAENLQMGFEEFVECN